jgi:hypothetical protein
VGLLVGIGLVVIVAAAWGTAIRTGHTRPEMKRSPAPPDLPGGKSTSAPRVIRLDEPENDSALAVEAEHHNGSTTVRVTGMLDERSALELGEYLSALVNQGSDRLIVDAQDAGPVPRLVHALAGVAFALEQRGARLALVGRRGERLAALLTLRASGLTGAIYVFDSLEDAAKGVGQTSA